MRVRLRRCPHVLVLVGLVFSMAGPTLPNASAAPIAQVTTVDKPAPATPPSAQQPTPTQAPPVTRVRPRNSGAALLRRSATPSVLAPEIDSNGGEIDVPGGELVVPPGALSERTRFSRAIVEARLARGLGRFHPLGEPVQVSAAASGRQASSVRLARAATIRLHLDEVAPGRLESARPGMRILRASG